MAQRFKAKTLLSNSGVFNNEVIAPNLVYNTGNQTISGAKSFSDRITFLNSTATNPFNPTLPNPFNPTISGGASIDNEATLDINAFKLNLSAGYGKSEYIELGGEEGRLNINTVTDTSTFNLGSNHNSSSANTYNITSPSINLYGQVNGQTGTFEKVNGQTGTFEKVNGQTGTFEKLFATGVIMSGNLQVSGTGIFNALDLNSIDIISLSGVDVTITSGVVSLTNPVVAPNIVYNTGNQTISGIKTFANSGIFNSGINLNNSKLINAVPEFINETTNFIISGNDNGRVILANHSTNEITGRIVSGNAIGFNTSIIQINSGIFITGSGNGITINSFGGYYRTAGKFATISLLHTGNNGYIMYGNAI